MRPLSLLTAAAGLLGFGTTQAQAAQQVAIIGAGPAGSSAAYYLQDYAAKAGIPLNITVFEKADRIGGRTLTINPYGDASVRVELGASVFIQANQIIYGAMQQFGLSEMVPDASLSPTLGIWDGNSFVLKLNDLLPSWWNTLQVGLRYGIYAPKRTQELVLATLGKFLQLYDEPHFPFRSLTQRVNELGLVDVTSVSGDQFLQANNVNAKYAQEVVQASTRANYASNIANLHALDCLISLAAEGATQVQGGNWQIFQKMVEASDATVALNTSVVGLELYKPGGQVSNPPKYTVRTTSGSSTNTPHPTPFDKVIIANPYQFSEISAAQEVIPNAIETIPYVKLHVTIFAAARRLNPGYFNPPRWAFWVAVPNTVGTTLAKTDNPNSGSQGVGKARFYSISTLQTVTNPANQKKEYIYKIFSPETLTPIFLSHLLGGEVPATFTGGQSPISWYYAHEFNSYPKAVPRTTFQEPIIGPGLYYTSGIEPFVSTMETSALMGKNVARILVDDIVAGGNP